MFCIFIKNSTKFDDTFLRYSISLYEKLQIKYSRISEFLKENDKNQTTLTGFVQWGILIDSQVINQFPINLFCQQQAVRTPLPTIHHSIP